MRSPERNTEEFEKGFAEDCYGRKVENKKQEESKEGRRKHEIYNKRNNQI